MDIGVDEPDLAARRLYESLGFTNRSDGDGPLMYVYERDLQQDCFEEIHQPTRLSSSAKADDPELHLRDVDWMPRFRGA